MQYCVLVLYLNEVTLYNNKTNKTIHSNSISMVTKWIGHVFVPNVSFGVHHLE